MKKIYKDKILNIDGTETFDSTFLFEYLENIKSSWERKIVYMRDLLQVYKNDEILKRVSEKPAMYSEVYSPKDELQIFTELFENALNSWEKIHIIWVTLGEEIQILEKYYEELWFIREDINAFDVDFSIPLVTVSCHIENLMWRGSDYKAQRDKIFFCPPVRESGQNKALFKGITRWVIAGIDMSHRNCVGVPLVGAQQEKTVHSHGMSLQYREFIWDCIRWEKILPLHMGKVLKYNLEDAGLRGNVWELELRY